MATPGPHREAGLPPRPYQYPARPSGRPSVVRRWDVHPQQRQARPEEESER